MRRFAANRICVLPHGTLLRNYVVEIDEITHAVLGYFPLVEEIQHTEWIGGIIMLSDVCPLKEVGETFDTFINKMGEKSGSAQSEASSLKAYHITAFNVNSMEFTKESQVRML